MKGVIFDLDDTLYNEKQFVYGAFKEVTKYLGDKYSIDVDIIYKQMKEILKDKGRGKIFNKICDMYGLDEDIPFLVEIYRRAKPKLTLYDDAEKFLKENKDKFRLGLITDGLYYVQWNKIKSLDIENYFNKIIVTDDYGKDFWKPSKEPYIKMSQLLNLPFEEMVYIGDNPNKDFFTAKKLGMKTIRVIREEGDHIEVFFDDEYEADFQMKSLCDLENILKKW